MAAAALDITCQCGETLHVPVAAATPQSYAGTANTLTVQLHVDHAFIARHVATHDHAGLTALRDATTHAVLAYL